MRDLIVAGNWKMNGNRQFIDEMMSGLNKAIFSESVKVVVCPPSVYLLDVSQKAKTVKVGAQNMYFEDGGAFTGELSPSMLIDVGCSYVVVGHSERREIFAEEDVLVAKKVSAAVRHCLTPILCVGESLEHRNSGQFFDVIARQVKIGLSLLNAENFADVVVAYEPIWAIGTGQTASPAQAQEVHELIRKVITELAGENVSERISILYGGSVNAASAQELFSQPDIDGGLVGGASLKIDEFIAICSAAAEVA
ncbi:triose-phosphate isomerase [Neptunomonas antarctica]|uniref:Triosephosphate isomerase n=1 Tax=Neptunomonas antarctica TaxID=619304 RepID=A0A1N7PL87_9GAMM|nr:triose-phosphate isomerase [Neptunomonas antarctica]SIT11260.1 triosephosphate isomerase [Neptunomonas antarctica]